METSASAPTAATMSPLFHTTRTLSAVSMAARTSRPRVRYFTSLSISPPYINNLKPYQSMQRPSIPESNSRSLSIVRCCSSITEKPLFDFQRKRKASPSPPDEKLRALRELFSKPGIGIDAYIIPSQDAHQSEFIAECFMRRTYISGFTGSAGTAVVTRDKAALWTDGRYFLQAEKQLSSSWTLMRAGNFGVPTTSEWLNDVLVPGCRIGIDPFLFSYDSAEELKEEISKKNHELVYLYDVNLVDEIWKESRPEPPRKPVRIHDLKYAGLDVSSKLTSLRSELSKAGSSAIVISMLDEVAWLLNLRGDDVPHSPVTYAYLTVEIDGAKLFIDNSKVPPDVAVHLKSSGVELRPYESILSEIRRDAVALAQFWAWLEEEISKNAVMNEVEVAEKLLEFRAKQDGFIGTSFDTISASGANGSIIHYKPEPENCSRVDAVKLFLLDSGAQYIDGTTDITRTVHFGEPTSRQKECFTRVLQGHIAIDEAVFPETTPGFVLDAFARSSLWKVGLDYRHGTGHGVGAALNVHEGPQSISFRFGNLTPLQRGMIVSNEPGYYEDHSFGIRIENLLFVKEVNTPNCYGGMGYLGFEKLTFVPIQSKLIDLSLLSTAEVNWLNEYHAQVWEKVSPFLEEGPARQWLFNNTRPLEKQ